MSSRRVLFVVAKATKQVPVSIRQRSFYTQAYPTTLRPRPRTWTSVQSPASRRYDSSHNPPIKSYTYEQISDLSTSPHPSTTLIDTREPSELQSTGKIPGAINIPVGSNPDAYFLNAEDFQDRFGFTKPDLKNEVVMYCKAGVRSRAAVRLAEQAGYKKVGSYDGSWLEWEKKGGEVEKV